MPTYDYVCDACEYTFEEFQSITASTLKKCPSCKKNKLRRLIGTGAGFIFKGGGFYETDYRSDGYKKDQKADSEASKSESKASDSSSKTDAKASSEGADGKKKEKPVASEGNPKKTSDGSSKTSQKGSGSTSSD